MISVHRCIVACCSVIYYIIMIIIIIVDSRLEHTVLCCMFMKTCVIIRNYN